MVNSKFLGGALAVVMVAPGVFAAPANQDVGLLTQKREALAEALALAEADPNFITTLFKDGGKLLGHLSGGASPQQQQQQQQQPRDAMPLQLKSIGKDIAKVGCAVGTFVPGVDVAVDAACIAGSAASALKKHGKRDALAYPIANAEAIAEAIANAYAEANPNFLQSRDAEAEASWVSTLEKAGTKLFKYGPDLVNGGTQVYQSTQQPHKRDAGPEAEAIFQDHLLSAGSDIFAREAEAEAEPEALAEALAEAFPDADPSIWSTLIKDGGKLFGGALGGSSSSYSQKKQRREAEAEAELMDELYARDAYADADYESHFSGAKPYSEHGAEAHFEHAPTHISSMFGAPGPAHAHQQVYRQQSHQPHRQQRREEYFSDLYIRDPEIFSYGYAY